MQVAFSHIPGYESFSEADFTDPAFMKQYLAKVLGICGLDVTGLVAEKQEDQEERKLLSAKMLDVVTQDQITVDEDGDMIFAVEDFPEEQAGSKSEELEKEGAQLSKKSAKKTNLLHKKMFNYDVAHSEYYGYKNKDYLNEAKRRAEKFVDYAKGDGFELQKFNYRAFSEKFYKLYENYTDMFPLDNEDGIPVEPKKTSDNQRRKAYFQAMTLKYILENPAIEKAFTSDKMESALNVDKFRS